MAQKRRLIAMVALLSCVATVIAQDYFDDVYYNPKKDTSSTASVSTKRGSTSTKSYYISDMADMDVDAYNRRGEQYYVSSIDTIGSGVENGEDFVYTQQIQKYYNPTIVVENANALGDVLSNAYGNVDIVINNNGYPVFAPYYGYNWSWPYYGSSWWSPYWSWNIGGWGWSIGWYDPWFSWGWGPGWWNPAPGWGPPPPPGGWWRPGPLATWSPRGNRPLAPRPGMGNFGFNRNPVGPGMGNHRPPVGNRPAGNRPQGVNPGRLPGGNPGMNRPAGVVNNSGKWQYNTSTPGNQGAGGNHRPHVGNTPPGKNNGSVGNNSSVSRPSTGGSNRNNSGSVGNSHNNSSNRSSAGSYRNSSGNRSTGGARTGGGSRSGGGSRGGGGGRHR